MKKQRLLEPTKASLQLAAASVMISLRLFRLWRLQFMECFGVSTALRAEWTYLVKEGRIMI